MTNTITKDKVNKLRKKYPIELGFDEIQPKEMKKPPQELETFRRLSRRDKKEKGKDFFGQDHIIDFLEKKWKIETYNKATYEWCCELLDKDFIYKQQITEEFRSKITLKKQDVERVIRKNARIDTPFRAIMYSDINHLYQNLDLKEIEPREQQAIDEINQEWT